jgi:hypothetical protein
MVRNTAALWGWPAKLLHWIAAVAYNNLTAACNTCHQSANRPFIVIQRPTGSAFPNQSFAPKRP